MSVSAVGRSRRRLRLSHAHFFVLPYVVLLLAFGIGPALYGVATGFFDTTTTTWRWVGLANYTTVLADFRLGPAFLDVLIFMLIWLPLLVVLVLALSLLLHARVGRFSAVMRMIYYLPGAVAGSASALLWLFMFDPRLSPFGPLLRLLGLHTLVDVLTPTYLPGIFAVIALFSGLGGWVVVVFGALTTIAPEVLEAATIDGCNGWQSAIYIKLPLVRRYIALMLILSFAGGVQLFVEPSIMNTATLGTIGVWSPNQLAYAYAFTDGNFGKSAAVSTGLLLIGLVGALLIVFGTDFYRVDAGEG